MIASPTILGLKQLHRKTHTDYAPTSDVYFMNGLMKLGKFSYDIR